MLHRGALRRYPKLQEILKVVKPIVGQNVKSVHTSEFWAVPCRWLHLVS